MSVRRVCLLTLMLMTLLLALSVECLQKYGSSLYAKTVCMRIGPRYQYSCAKLTTVDNKQLQWVDKVRYLGIYTVSALILNV